MAIYKVLGIGLAGNEISKEIAGSNKVSAGRTAVAIGAGAVMGMVTEGAIVVATSAISTTASPVIIPLALGGAVVAGIASLFDSSTE
jgi:hypothetical protein